MKKILQLVVMTAVLMISGIALSQMPVEWRGIDWDAYEAARIAVNYDKHLVVEPTRYYGGAAHYSTSYDFRSAKTPWVEATFYDDGVKNSIQLVMRDKGRAYTQIGIWGSHKSYVIYWSNSQVGRLNGVVGTAVTRTPGLHTIKLAMQENGTVDYWIDNARVWSTNNISPDNFEDIYLTAQVSPATFFDYKFGTDYRPPLLALDISIDIKPGHNPNSINRKSKGVVPVAILTTEVFDATRVDHTKTSFAGAMETHVDKKSGERRRHEEDVDGDGDIDLMFHFRRDEIDLDSNSTEATLTLTGETFDGQLIRGTDTFRMIE